MSTLPDLRAETAKITLGSMADTAGLRDEASTLRDVRSEMSAPALWGRRVATALLIVLVVAGGTGLLGVHTATATAAGGGYALTVSYARVARAGWDVPLRIDVEGEQELHGKTLALTIDRAYLDIFETQGLWPDPSEESGDATAVQWQFDGPGHGRHFTVEYDAYIQPSSQIGASTRIALAVDGQPATAVNITTTLLP